MRIEEWNQRYRYRERPEDFNREPAPLITRWLGDRKPGRVLDLACGLGRHSLWLAERRWQVTAVDGSNVAVSSLCARVLEFRFALDAKVADLGAGEFVIPPASFDVILDCYYLQRDLFPAIRSGVRPGGLVISIVHLAWPDEVPTYKHAAAGELCDSFAGWEILHYREGDSEDSAHRRPVAEIVARRPRIQ